MTPRTATVVRRTRELVGLVRTVVFSPEDLALVKGDPAERRRFLDDLLVLRTPRLAGLRADYDRVLKQRNSLLKSMLAARRGRRDDEYAASTLAVWDEQLAQHGAELLAARVGLVEDLRPYVGKAYEAVARGASREDAEVEYRPTVPVTGDLAGSFLATGLAADGIVLGHWLATDEGPLTAFYTRLTLLGVLLLAMGFQMFIAGLLVGTATTVVEGVSAKALRATVPQPAPAHGAGQTSA